MSEKTELHDARWAKMQPKNPRGKTILNKMKRYSNEAKGGPNRKLQVGESKRGLSAGE